MKQGDTVPVTIAGQVVAQATVKELGEGEVTLIVPGTIVRMAVRTEIAPEATVPEGAQVEEPVRETLITGVDRADGSGGVEETPVPPMPPITAPSETTNEVVTQTAPVEQASPTVSDEGNTGEPSV